MIENFFETWTFMNFVVLFAVGVILTVFFRWLAPRVGWVDSPGTALKVHAKSTPYLGGAGIIGTVITGLVLYKFSIPTEKVYVELLGIVILFILGLIDDRWSISARSRLLIQVGVSTATVYMGQMIQPTGVFWFDSVLSVFFIVSMINALNILDILDGLAAGISTLLLIAFAFLLFRFNGEEFYIMLSLFAVVGLIAFLVFNFNPASIFMGDAGSTVLGFLLAMLFVHTYNAAPNVPSQLAAITVMSLPLFELIYVSWLRISRGENPMRGSKDHFPLRIHFSGYSVKKTVLIVYFMTFFTCILATLMSYQNLFISAFTAVFLLVGYVLIGFKLAKIKIK